MKIYELRPGRKKWHIECHDVIFPSLLGGVLTKNDEGLEMAIIKNKSNLQKVPIKAKVNVTVLTQIKHYCEWSGIFDLGYFIEQAAEHVFRKDLEWKQFNKEKAES
ncbi:MAG: hypothetical protein H0U70_12775 [Tatlockia sp.]|nr:hypothetical protein [Tatlockia sp.]